MTAAAERCASLARGIARDHRGAASRPGVRGPVGGLSRSRPTPLDRQDMHRSRSVLRPPSATDATSRPSPSPPSSLLTSPRALPIVPPRPSISTERRRDERRQRARRRETPRPDRRARGRLHEGASHTLVPIRPRRRGERRSLRTLPGASLRPGSLAFNPRPRRLSTPTDAFQLHPDVRSYGTTLKFTRVLKRKGVSQATLNVAVRARPLSRAEMNAGARTITRLVDEKCVVIMDPDEDDAETSAAPGRPKVRSHHTGSHTTASAW